MTEQEYWDKTMNEIRRTNKVLLAKQEGREFIPIIDDSDPPIEFVFVDHQTRKVMAPF